MTNMLKSAIIVLMNSALLAASFTPNQPSYAQTSTSQDFPHVTSTQIIEYEGYVSFISNDAAFIYDRQTDSQSLIWQRDNPSQLFFTFSGG